jgi:hypothetical protein
MSQSGSGLTGQYSRLGLSLASCALPGKCQTWSNGEPAGHWLASLFCPEGFFV